MSTPPYSPQLAVLLSMFAFLCSQARIVELKMSTCSEPYAVAINNISKSLNADDKLIINFDKKGKYRIDRTVRARCDVLMMGVGRNKTQIIVTEGVDNTGKSLFTNDCYFFFEYPKGGNKGEVIVKDLSITMEKHSKQWWPCKEMHLFKIMHASKVTIENTSTSMHNEVITNFDLRSCSNVRIANNEIVNYHDAAGGGCVWSRDNQRNVLITNNVIKKSGRDEAIAVWGSEKSGNFVIENVEISSNDISYSSFSDDDTDLKAHILITLGHYKDQWVENSHCNISNINITGNHITLDYPLKYVMMVKFDQLATKHGIVIKDNSIYKSRKCAKLAKSTVADFLIEDGSMGNSTVLIEGNSSRGEKVALDRYALNCYVFLSLTQGKVALENNVLNYSGDLRLLHLASPAGGAVALTGNEVNGLYNLASIISDNSVIDKVDFVAQDNKFAGDTRIYLKNLNNGVFKFIGNTFRSNNYHLLFQDLPLREMSLIFERNNVISVVDNATMCANYSGFKGKFNSVTIKDNIFRGIRDSASLFGDLSKSRKKFIEGNLLYR